MGAKSASIEQPRIANLIVQQSALGSVIPVGWGTGRVAPNLLWFNGFRSQAVTTRQGGKGGGGVNQTSYTYSADLIMGFHNGPVTAITRVYVDKSQFGSVAEAGLSLATGAIGQAVWGYLASTYPSQALGYSGIAYVYAAGFPLGESATIGNHSFEVQFVIRAAGLPDANPKDVLIDLLTNYVTGWKAGLIDDLTDYGNYCLASNLLVSPVLDQQVQASQFVSDLMETSNSGVFWSEGLIKVRPYGDTSVTGNAVTWNPNLTPAYAIGDDDWLSEGEDPLTIDKRQQDDCYNQVQIEYQDRSNQYNTAIMPASDAANIAAFGPRKEDPKQLHMIKTSATAKVVAQLRVQRLVYIRDDYRFDLPWNYALLEPMDLVSVTDTDLGVIGQLVRIIQIEDDEDAVRSIIAEPVLVGTAAAPLYPTQAPAGTVINQDVAPGSVERNLILWSEAFDNAAWVKSNLGVTPSATTPPAGLSRADKLTENTTASVSHSARQGVVVLTGVTHSDGLFLKAAERTQAMVQLYDGTNSAAIVVNLTTGATISTAPTGAFADAVFTVTDAGSGWWRVSVTDALPISPVFLYVYPCVGGNPIYAGTVGQGIYVAGACLNPGAPGDYVQTWGSPACPVLFTPPAVMTPGGAEVWAAAAGGVNWGGADVYLSFDNVNYSLVGKVTSPARFGYLTAVLASATDPDTTNTLSVDLAVSRGALTDPNHIDADNGGTPCLVGTEIINFGEAVLTAGYGYDLDYLRRGSLNTNIGAHAAGDAFIRLDDSVFKFPLFAPQVGEVVYVKFCSFNVYGRATESLAAAYVHAVIPIPIGAAPAGSAAWVATGTTFNNVGQSIAAIVYTGASDNPSADGVAFLYRLTGSTAWVSSGWLPITITRHEITSVTSDTQYDTAVQYLVNGVPGQILVLGTITVGQTSTTGGSGGGAPPGTVDSVLLSDSVPGVGKTYTCVSGTYGHIDIELVANGGQGSADFPGGKTPPTYTGGGGGGFSQKLTIPVTPGVTVVTYTIRAQGSGSTSTCSVGAVSLTCNPGTSASGLTQGVGGTASGGDTNTTGHNGGLTNTYDGGGCGGGVDQTNFGQGGTTPGGGGSGMNYDSGTGVFTAAIGANARILITART